jgi:nucleoside-diphosphate-sugar epimerase
LDVQWFVGNTLNRHDKLTVIKGDIRDTNLLKRILPGHEIVLHLAAVANDASFELNEAVSTTINYEAFEPLVNISKSSGVRRFIYASSSSVYGISNEPDVREDHPLVPLTLYNKYKALCEPILLDKLDNNFEGVVFRPATVCGYSPRQRLDLTVNILTNLAFHLSKITVFGGTQRRPNLNIKDYSRACRILINSDVTLIQGQVFNVGSQNLSVTKIATMVQELVANYKNISKDDITIENQDTNDLRSYHINSDKIYSTLGFKPNHSVESAIIDLCDAFENQKLTNTLIDSKYFNVKHMREKAIS